jgi:hypothetical protein
MSNIARSKALNPSVADAISCQRANDAAGTSWARWLRRIGFGGLPIVLMAMPYPAAGGFSLSISRHRFDQLH